VGQKFTVSITGVLNVERMKSDEVKPRWFVKLALHDDYTVNIDNVRLREGDVFVVRTGGTSLTRIGNTRSKILKKPSVLHKLFNKLAKLTEPDELTGALNMDEE
jgi:hypothetical protein